MNYCRKCNSLKIRMKGEERLKTRIIVTAVIVLIYSIVGTLTEKIATVNIAEASTRQLTDTNDADIADMLAKRFGAMTIDECRTQKGDVFNKVKVDITELYRDRGITIKTVGVNGGLSYVDAKIDPPEPAYSYPTG
jgi:hypothetical protein